MKDGNDCSRNLSLSRYEYGQVIQSRAIMDNLLRILDRFLESLDVLSGVQHQQVVISRKCKMADVNMVCEDGEEYRKKG